MTTRSAVPTDVRWTIGINLLWLVPNNVGGTEEYAMRLLRSLPAVMAARPQAAAVRIVIFATPAVVAAYPWIEDLGRTEVCRELGDGRVRRVLTEASWLQRHSKDCSFVHHLGGTIPVGNRTPALVTVHDLQPFDRPSTFSRAKRAWLQRRLPASIADSTVVMTPTRWVADQIQERFGTSPSRLAVVASSYDSADPGETVDVQVERRRRMGLPERYVLYPAITYEHKNHRVLIKALARSQGDIDLVMTGRADVAEAETMRLADDLGVRAHVHRLGRIDRLDFAAVLAGSTGLVFPSVYEGFGLPIIEAMAARVPVVASDTEVLREVAGGAARLVAPEDPGLWAREIDRLSHAASSDPAAFVEVVEAGVERSRAFRSAVSAARLFDVYARVLGLDGSVRHR